MSIHFNLIFLHMSILFSNFAVEIKGTFSPPETRLIGCNMMIIELGTHCTDVDVQMQAIKEINTLTSEYSTPIEVNGLWNNYIVIKSLMMIPTVANDFVINLVTLIQTRQNLDHYYFNEVTINRETL